MKSTTNLAEALGGGPTEMPWTGTRSIVPVGAEFIAAVKSGAIVNYAESPSADSVRVNGKYDLNYGRPYWVVKSVAGELIGTQELADGELEAKVLRLVDPVLVGAPVDPGLPVALVMDAVALSPLERAKLSVQLSGMVRDLAAIPSGSSMQRAKLAKSINALSAKIAGPAGAPGARGVEGLVLRQSNAANRFIESSAEQFGMSAGEAGAALDRLLKLKLVKLDPLSGQFNLKDGRFWDGEVLRRAAVEQGFESILDDAAQSPLQRVKLAHQLAEKVGELTAASSQKGDSKTMLQLARLAKEINDLCAQLGGKSISGKHEKVLSDIIAGGMDAAGLAAVIGAIRTAVNALLADGALSDPVEAMAHAAITHWAKLEAKENA